MKAVEYSLHPESAPTVGYVKYEDGDGERITLRTSDVHAIRSFKEAHESGSDVLAVNRTFQSREGWPEDWESDPGNQALWSAPFQLRMGDEPPR
jgi:hypothetical protein